MKLQTSMLNSLKYIEENLKEPLTAEAVAQNAGYSLYYFSRIFKRQMGLSVMEYVKDRRLIKASEEIAKGMKIIDAALDLGYQSHSGFTKAFTNKFVFSLSNEMFRLLLFHKQNHGLLFEFNIKQYFNYRIHTLMIYYNYVYYNIST